MKRISTWLLAVLALTAGSAQAALITINYTADNIVSSFGVCVESDCSSGSVDLSFGAPAFTTGSNVGQWKLSDTFVVELAPGTYDIGFVARNTGSPSANNPAGLLAEILWDGNVNLSSSAWDVTTDGFTWVSATEWWKNGTGIWGNNNLPRVISPISPEAQWIWTANNFDSSTESRAAFRTSITVAAVPEPGTLLLLGLGVLGLGFSRRKTTSR